MQGGPGCKGTRLAGCVPSVLQEALPGGGGGLLHTAGLATRLAPRPGGLPRLLRRQASPGSIPGDPSAASGRGGWEACARQGQWSAGSVLC